MCDIMEEQQERKKIIPQSIEKEMKRSYIDYSMSVIVGRALPDIRDGLKPVHRKILYAMSELGLPYNRPHKKSARVVGEVLGKYHPHGDSAAYESMVRMAQTFSLRYPLVDGQGNFGSVDGDSPAAMRYTEARLSKISSDMLADIDKNTVDFVDNFDGSLKEPSVLPAKIPNLLVNGSDGIAVGMATKMPPHNLTEVCDAIIHAIDNPEADVFELMRFIKGPDFPTGGTVYGLNGIISAYATGRGKIKVRANTHFEEIGNGKSSIIIDELPYQVNKAALLEAIAEQVKDKVLEDITDLRDESDRDGMRVVIELHKDAIDNVVLENLFKKTQMQITYGIINLALVNNKPTVLTLKEMIDNYISFRTEIVVRRTQFDLEEAEKRYHILEGLMKALGMLDETIALIRASKDAAEANTGLQGLLKIDEEQAKEILALRLQKLTGLEIDSLREETNQKIMLMKDLRDILGDHSRVLSIIKDELKKMKDDYGDERKTIINENALDVDEEDLIPMEDVVITISADNYIKRIPLNTYRQQARGGVGLIGMQTKEEDYVSSMFVASSHDYLMFITNHGRLHWLKGYRVPEGSRQSKGKPIINMISDLEEGEMVVSTICVHEFPENEYLAFCTKNGLLKKTSLSAYKNVRARGIKAIKFDEGDELIETSITEENDQIIIATKNGQAVRFNESDVRSTGRDTMGVKGVTLNEGDAVISMAVVRPEDKLLTVTENGYGKISDVADYRQTNRGAKGVITIKTDERNGKVVSVRKVSAGDQLMVTSMSGKMIRMSVDEIRETGRNAKGVRIMDMRDGDKVTAVQPIISEGEGEGAEEKNETTAP
ncbi:DNA gyrase subunit A [Candidatus Methanoplasma termitum]|uniref:DNA gyrase subunit A n=2 Tax=Candidatus Methanoplasma termitum TaxID=1577791 RepID=A0A0A7LIE3_9ARCH|nr:DNA gyrase subunit A [Candidatus Methanoplasma termitum]